MSEGRTQAIFHEGSERTALGVLIVSSTLDSNSRQRSAETCEVDMASASEVEKNEEVCVIHLCHS